MDGQKPYQRNFFAPEMQENLAFQANQLPFQKLPSDMGKMCIDINKVYILNCDIQFSDYLFPLALMTAHS